MARFVIWSDLHMEFQGFKLPKKSDFSGPFDAVLLPGDTDTGQALCHVEFAKRVADAYGVPVIMVLGNHEYYGCEIHALETAQSARVTELNAQGYDIHILQGDQVTIADTRIIGATLWTDFDLDPAAGLRSRQTAETIMNDYRNIKIDDGGIRPLRAHDTEELHRSQKEQIFSLLSEDYDGPTLVMTHHMPIAQGVHKKYLHHPVNAAFASNMLREIEGFDFDVWLYGHSHQNNELHIDTPKGMKSFISNPRGYPNEVTRFNPLRIIEV